MSTTYPRIQGFALRPKKSCTVPCTRCGGSGRFGHLGTCFRCGGVGGDPTAKDWAFPADWDEQRCKDWLDARAKKCERDRLARRRRSDALRQATRDENLSNHAVLTRVLEYARLAAEDLPKRAQPLEVQCSTEWESRLLRQIADKIASFVISKKQADLCEKIFNQIEHRIQQRQRYNRNLVEPDRGRREICGTVASVKTYETQYGASHKILIKCDGYSLFGTAPASIAYDVERGDSVSLTATVTPVERGFGKFSRPTKASLKKKQAAVA